MCFRMPISKTQDGKITMSKYEELRKAHVEARKNRSEISSFIGYVISEVEKNAVVIDGGVKTYPDLKVMAVLKNLNKKLAEAATPNQDELDFIVARLPTQLSESEICDIFQTNCAGQALPLKMKFLAENYAGQYDGKMAAMIAKSS